MVSNNVLFIYMQFFFSNIHANYKEVHSHITYNQIGLAAGVYVSPMGHSLR
jgi:hypothetical protein